MNGPNLEMKWIDLTVINIHVRKMTPRHHGYVSQTVCNKSIKYSADDCVETNIYNAGYRIANDLYLHLSLVNRRHHRND